MGKKKERKQKTAVKLMNLQLFLRGQNVGDWFRSLNEFIEVGSDSSLLCLVVAFFYNHLEVK